MLTPQENKLVLSTLSKRRAWLQKTLDDGDIDDKARNEHSEMLKLLESAMSKVASFVGKPAPGSRKSLTLQTSRLLIADDNTSSAEVLVSMLEEFGIKDVDVAKDGRQAFDKIKNAQDPYDIILCDWDMPELSGLEVHEKAKASNTLRGAHFCMVTGVSEAKKIREAIQQGVNDYIVKPIDADTLLAKIKATIDAKALAEKV